VSAPAGSGVLLAAHGTPESLDQMAEYLTAVRGGRAPSPALLGEMRHNYAAIGGRSPLTDITRAQAAALARALDGLPVFVGMRNWSPFIADAVSEAERAGVRELVVVPLAPQYSAFSVGKYRQAVEAALPASMHMRFVESWHAEPGLLEAFAQRVRAALAAGPADVVVFTAHSLPLRAIEQGDPYARQVQQTAAGVAALAGLPAYEQAWQSAGRTEEPWLAPSLEERLAALAEQGMRRVLVAPIGFVCDHTEILYDIDQQAQTFARERGLELRRTESLNTAPLFIEALAAVVRRALA
jgi:protoporphyrin/coproporphyrin ferrochelatase